ncbi:MAG: hypothetical protein ACR2MQ_09460 [Gemmatimonadaceae bacterium]
MRYPTFKADTAAFARTLIVVGVALTPLFSIGELLALLRGLVQSQVVAYTPVYVKSVKDILMLVLIMLGLMRIARSGRTNLLAMPFLILLLYTAVVAVLASDSLTLALAGLRWIVPVFVTFFIYEFVDQTLMQRLARLLGLMLIVQFSLQIVELFFMSHWYGSNAFGLAARVPGFFLIPITAGFFAMTVLFFVHFYAGGRTLRRVTYAIVPASIFLTQSGTGLVVFAVVAALLILGIRRIWLLLPVGAAAVAVLFPLLPALTGRQQDYVAVSGGTRLDIFLNLFRHSEWVPTAFGYVTNTAVSLVANGASGLRTDAIPTIVDSTYASILGNLGVGGAIFFALFCLTWAITVICSRRLDLYVATVIFVLYGVTTIMFEAYPMNLLMAVCGAYFLKQAYLPFWTGRTRWSLAGSPRASSAGDAQATILNISLR